MTRAALVSLLFAAACGSDGDGRSKVDVPDTGVDSAAPDTTGGLDTTSATDATAPDTIADVPEETTCAVGCSADLHQGVDCDGNVVATCPEDQGCEAGACVDACDAAAAQRSSVGCEYYAMNPDILTVFEGSCYAAFVANTWRVPVSIQVEYRGQTLDTTTFARLPVGTGAALTYAPLSDGQLQPGQVAILFLAQAGTGLRCPAGITVAYSADVAGVHGSGLGDAFHITTSAPVVAYDSFPYGGGASALASATLLLPTSTWDRSYLAIDAFARSDKTEGLPVVALVANEDNTTITMRPTVAIEGGPGIAPAAAGSDATFVLQEGQVLQLSQGAELIGSAVSADKPIGLWGGASCMSVPLGRDYCDAAHQQIPPLSAMGHRYAGVRHKERYAGLDESPPWRLVGGADGTLLTWQPSKPAGAPDRLDFGEVAQFDATGPFSVASQDAQHPFYMAAYMTGCMGPGPGGSDCRGDPEFVNVVALDQFLATYTFFTDPSYPETSLVLTREKHDGVFADVTLGCAGVVTGWKPLGDGSLEYTYVNLSTGNFEPVGACDNGVHVASSTRPFGLVVWGWGSGATGTIATNAVSYAYPGGVSVRPIDNLVVDSPR